MKYTFQNKTTGKSFAQMIQLKQNIEKGIDCAVATLSPEKMKRDFEYMTGAKLILTSTEGNNSIFNASL